MSCNFRICVYILMYIYRNIYCAYIRIRAYTHLGCKWLWACICPAAICKELDPLCRFLNQDSLDSIFILVPDCNQY